ncbi:hypothetical protein EUX98_g7592 [Antrodiella citrinella]|uniref:Uncharacterized protein n=1 Tax=Antrodiella citrinella TaxID=2447956 RepID=A0A4S4ML58_9APHY|nr:hypothetical protein EUX98_g7592 [Antrodiella citrinella]
MDVLSRKVKRSRGNAGSDDDSDDGPPPDPDEPAPVAAPKKEKKKAGESKEVQVSVRKVNEEKGMSFSSGLTAVRREMLLAIRAEEDEKWEDYEYCDGEAVESNDAFESILSRNEEILDCKTDITKMLKDIAGLL